MSSSSDPGKRSNDGPPKDNIGGSPGSDSCQVLLRHACAMFSAVRVAIEERAFVYALVALTCFAVRRTMENTLV